MSTYLAQCRPFDLSKQVWDKPKFVSFKGFNPNLIWLCLTEKSTNKESFVKGDTAYNLLHTGSFSQLFQYPLKIYFDALQCFICLHLWYIVLMFTDDSGRLVPLQDNQLCKLPFQQQLISKY